MTEFGRGFRLHPARGGPVLDGCQFPDGRVLVIDDPDYVLTTAAPSLDALLRGGYHGARIEWPERGPAEHCGEVPPTAIGARLQTECVLRPGHQGSHADETGMRWWMTAPLPAGEPCTDPHHTGPARERYGCSGPDPVTTQEI